MPYLCRPGLCRYWIWTPFLWCQQKLLVNCDWMAQKEKKSIQWDFRERAQKRGHFGGFWRGRAPSGPAWGGQGPKSGIFLILGDGPFFLARKKKLSKNFRLHQIWKSHRSCVKGYKVKRIFRKNSTPMFKREVASCTLLRGVEGLFSTHVKHFNHRKQGD